MDQTYSVAADFLSKFSTWPGGIQALWIVSLTLIALALIFASVQILGMMIRATMAGRLSREKMIAHDDTPLGPHGFSPEVRIEHMRDPTRLADASWPPPRHGRA